MRVSLLTREFPPEVYGGAGVHVEFLARFLGRLVDVDVHCWGADRGADGVVADVPWERLKADRPHAGALQAMSVELAQALDVEGADVVHTHTWYTQLAGHLASLLYGVPHVATVHSLEPLRPWKAEQLGGGYQVSSWVEKTALEGAAAVIAVSGAVRHDVLTCYPAIDPARVHVIHNGVDLDAYVPRHDDALLRSLGVDPSRPSVLFVGRITRQKGISHLLAAAPHLPEGTQLVLRASAPDTPEIAAEVAAGVEAARAAGHDVVFVEHDLARADLSALLASCTVFCCPSVYEPFGLVNVEAMACGAPVVATATGGIVEIVDDGVTGLLVTPEPEPEKFARSLGEALTRVIEDPPVARAMGAAGRAKVEREFSWTAVAQATVDLYRSLLA